MPVFSKNRGSGIIRMAINIHCLVAVFSLLASSVIVAQEHILSEGISEYEAENYEEAQVILLWARESLPDSSEVVYYLGLTYIQTGDYEKAARHLNEAARLTPPVKEAFTELIDVLYNMGRLEEAEGWLARAEDRDILPARVAYLKGLVFAKMGRSEEAIAAFNKVKELDSALAQRSGLKIALLYAKDKRFAQAKQSLRAVIDADPQSELAALAKEYEKSIEKRQRAYRRLRLTVGAFYQYDDNVMLRPIDDEGLEIAGEEKDSSGVATARLTFKSFLEGPWILNLHGNLYSNTYFNESSHNLINGTFSINPGYNFKKGAFTIPVSYSHLWLEEDNYMDLYGMRPMLSMMVVPHHIIQLNPGIEKRDVLVTPANEDEDRDSINYTASVGYILTFFENRGVFNLRYAFSRNDAEGRNWENTGNELGLNILLPLTETTRLMVSGDVFSKDYLRTHSTYNKKRQDAIYTAGISLMWRVYGGLDLIVRYGHTTAESNISVYEYNRNVYSAGLEYSF